MTVTTLVTTFRRSAWRRQFADCLIKLRPDMNPDAADELSDRQYLLSAHLHPEIAAQLCASGVTPKMTPTEAPTAAANEG
jgi:hypothetical protein